MITEVNKYNAQQNKLREEYLAECKANKVEPQSKYMQDVMFPTFDYKRGYVLEGRYPIYNRLKRNLQ
jgi:hypothetical protein